MDQRRKCPSYQHFRRSVLWSQNSFFPYADFIFSSSSPILPHPLYGFHPLFSSLPKRKSEKVPEKPLFLCFLKGSGEEETRKEKDAEEKKPRAIRWPEKGKRGGEKDTQRGPDFYLSFLPPQEKLKSAGRKD